MKRKMTKIILAGMMSLAIAVSGFVFAPENVNAAEQEAVVQYQPVDYGTFKTCIESQKAPTCTLEDKNEGYLFGGWYTYENGQAGTVIESVNDVEENATNIAAKFVPSHIAGIACQVSLDVGEAETTNLRIVSAVDSADYKAVGFNVYGREKKGDGTYDEWVMYRYASDNSNKAQSSKVYYGMYVYRLDENGEAVVDHMATPEATFGKGAAYFTTMLLSGIPKASFSTTIVIKPYWITMDGTMVEGLGEFDRVQDGIDGIVNISVNLKNAEAIAIGMLNVTYDTDNFTYVEAECGRVFDEMSFAQAGNTVKCIGNVSNIANAAEPNDIYVNLRFQKTNANSLSGGKAKFTVTVPEKGFANIDEEFADVTAWNVKY